MKYIAYSSLHGESGPYKTWADACEALKIYKDDAKQMGIIGKNNICLDVLRIEGKN